MQLLYVQLVLLPTSQLHSAFNAKTPAHHGAWQEPYV